MLHNTIVVALFAVSHALPSELQAKLEGILQHEASKYNCSFTLAVRTGDSEIQAAAGIADFSTGRVAKVSDHYPWGSVTKMFTAASIMKLVAAGRFALDDKVAPLVNPFLAKMAARDPSQNFSSLEDLWGDHVANTTLRQLLGMTSGIPDFDTATPPKPGVPAQDPLRASLYKTPDHFTTPTELMGVPWVSGHFRNCTIKIPGLSKPFCYSSTNFMLLGLVLASQASSNSWRSFDQSSYLPASLRKELRFANRGAPKDYGAEHGYDRTSYNRPKGQLSDHDNWAVDGVFAGWTASNIIGSASAVANLTWEIFGPPSSVAPKEFVQQMIPHPTEFYGLGAFNMVFVTGHNDTLGRAYGHLGATYGYQSIAIYFPELKISMAVATNIEKDLQPQPSDAICLAYNAVAGALLGKAIDCEFVSAGYFGRCMCRARGDLTAERVFV